MTPIEKELARKLAWAVISTLAPPANLKYRVRVWAWRLACKMVAAKSQFRVDNPLPPPDNGMAGGGAARVSYRSQSAPSRSPGRPTPSGGGNASPDWESPEHVRHWSGGPRCGSYRVETASCDRCGTWWRRVGSVRGSAGSSHDRGRWIKAAPTSQARIDRRRYADGVDHRKRNLEESGRELCTPANTEVILGGQCVL